MSHKLNVTIKRVIDGFITLKNSDAILKLLLVQQDKEETSSYKNLNRGMPSSR